MERLMLRLVFASLVCIMVNCSSKGEVSIQDTTPPSEPTGLSGASTSSTSVVLNWNASTDNVGVAGYKVFRNGAQINNSVSTSCTDTGLASSTTYFYAVAAYDAADNVSVQTSIISVTTLTLNTPNGSTNNNFTMLDSLNNPLGGANDVNFIWDGTMKTSVAASGQISNATISSTCPFFGFTWNAHDVAIYGPGTYTVYTDCPAGSPGCGVGTPITFTVGAGEIGGHLLFNWASTKDTDVVNVWKQNAVFAPSPLYAGGCGFNSAATVWGWMSKDPNGDGVNGYPMADGPFMGTNANFNLNGGNNLCFSATCNDNNPCTTDACNPTTGNCVHTAISCDDNNPCTDDTCDPTAACVHTLNNSCYGSSNNNFTLLDTGGNITGGTNSVNFTWDGTMKASVATSGQVSNATISSTCPFFGLTWRAHDVAIYGPGAYTVYAGCPAGSPGCGVGAPITFTVGAGELGGHILFDWGATSDVDVVNVWQPGAVFGPSPMWTGACGSNSASTVWGWMSTDVNGDGINGYPMVDGPFLNFNANFNLM